MRRQLISSDSCGLCVHDHAAWCGDGPDALDHIAVSVFSGAAKRGELMVFVSEQPDPQRLADLDDLEVLISRGSLRLTSTDATYRQPLDEAAQRAVFEELVDEALTDGYSGLCVVADNSPMASGTDDDFAAWLGWEAAADQLQATRPVSGVCYFDRRVVSNDRMADLAVLHPVPSADFETPSFQLFVDGDAVRVVGEMDFFCIEQLNRLLASAPKLTERVLDLSEVDFIDHQTLLALNELASSGQAVRVRGATDVVRRVWSILDLQSPALEFC